MGDSSETRQQLQQLQNLKNDANYRRCCFLDLLEGDDAALDLNKSAIRWISDDADCFVSLSRGNESIKHVSLYPYSLDDGNDGDAGNYKMWDRVGQAIGNLQSLEWLKISRDYGIWTSTRDYYDEANDIPTPDWKILALILSHVRQNVKINFVERGHPWAAGEAQAFTQAIRGHPTITSFDSISNGESGFPYESLDALYSTLATLPALEYVLLIQPEQRLPDESALGNPESLTELLRVPTLRSFHFHRFCFTHALCQATANALMKGTAITKLVFFECSFPAEESATIMASGLSRNTSVASIEIMLPLDQTLHNALTAAIPSNSTLRDISMCLLNEHSPLLLALGKNTGVKALAVSVVGEARDASLCIAMADGLGINETLESLEISHVPLYDDNVDLWCNALYFLRSNKALKSLVVKVREGATQSCVSTLRGDIARTLKGNTSLENLSILCGYSVIIKAEEYIALVAALQHNTTLKTMQFYKYAGHQLTEDEAKQMALLLKKNYAFQRLPDISPHSDAGDLGAILRLNEAGRRYLVQDGSSISKGVEVLSRVKNDVNCVFLHLLENPTLCDRSAVEIVTAGESHISSSTSPTASSGGGKREQASAHRCKESRRRLA
jgi:hypothetical protein